MSPVLPTPAEYAAMRWVPLQQIRIPQQLTDKLRAAMDSQGIDPTEEQLHEVWQSPTHEAFVRYMEPDRGRAGALHLSIKRLDRAPIHDWRHLQAIKNDVAGPEREGVELYPAESRLVDQANQNHLWVMAAGVRLPIGFPEREVLTEEQGRKRYPDAIKARQRPWQPNISTGPKYRR